MLTPKSWEICWAMRKLPNVGLRRFISTIAAVSSGGGPLGPGLRHGAEEEKSRRYFRSINALGNFNSVAGLRIAESFGTRCGLTKRLVNPMSNRSAVVRFGARCRERLMIKS